MVILTIVVGLLTAVLLVPAVSDLFSLLRVPFSRRRRALLTTKAPSEMPRLLFLVPAHNEERMIESCVRSLTALQYPADRFAVVVLADNCSDRTVELARSAGAQCLERHDQKLPGKPRAIAWALPQLPLHEFESMIIIDADTIVDPSFATALANAGPLRHKAFQAYFDVRNPGDSLLTQMNTVLAAANYRFAYALKRRVGLNAPLMGNGMCLGTAILEAQGWRAFTIAEDWESYALYTIAGIPIESLVTARLYAQEANSLAQSSTQRKRWTAGKLTVLGRLLVPLLRSREIDAAQKLDAVGELTAQGPVVHLGLVLVAGLLTALLQPPAAGLLLAGLATSVARLGIYAILGLSLQPHPFRSAAAFAFLPFYMLWRLGAAVAALRQIGDKPWVRTARD